MSVPDEVVEKMLDALFTAMGQNPPISDINAMRAALSALEGAGYEISVRELPRGKRK